jgi:hypothetical protein
MKHTPGPWEIVDDIIETVKAPWITVCRICLVGDDGAPPKSESIVEANARVIAAAPELLEACKRMLAHIDGVKSDDDLFVCRKLISDAIAKAEGK